MERAVASALATKRPRGDQPGWSYGTSALTSWRHSCLEGLTTWQLNRVVALLANEHIVRQREVAYSLLSCSFQKHLLCNAGGWTHASVMFLFLQLGQLSTAQSQPGPLASHLCECPGNSPVDGWAWQALANDSKNVPLRHHHEGRRAKLGQQCSVYWQVHEQTQ